MKEDPGDSPAAKDPYMMIFWQEEEKLNGVLALVELLHSKDDVINGLIKIINQQKERLNKWNM